MKINKHFLTFCFLGLTLSISAYDAMGHRIVADIAYDNLTDKARQQVDKVLGKRGIVYDATWADEVRSDNKYKYSYQWHYQDLDDNMTTDGILKLMKNPKAEGEHLFFAIDTLTTRLKRDKNDAEALKFLVHFIGDETMPLHCSDDNDKGGNDKRVRFFSCFSEIANLHGV